ncbi:hypothetical protein DSO57_1006952 [Entomophthora muscae]|uniref:Uncharacterized protein n=1 Tax=Entomophthora muscae TaxID=34485 RepID=A0ACC2TI87_9FUNG|nr:hypothetical protein DSO57_1006952 [Entomophthora muscae]
MMKLILLSVVQGLGINGGGCAVTGSRVLALGGFVDSSLEMPNRKVYYLEMDSPIELDSTGAGPWREAGELEEALGFGPTLTTKEDGSVFAYGGSLQQGSTTLKILDQDINLHSIGDVKTASRTAITGASMVQNDLIPTEYIVYGGLVIGPDGNEELGNARAFDSVRSRWVDENKDGPLNSGHVTAVFKGVMYVIGSHTKETIDAYNIRSSEWYKVPTKGSPPPDLTNPSSFQNSSHVFIAGAAPSSIYVLDLISMAWSNHHISGFPAVQGGCLAYRSGYLIHAFGTIDSTLNQATSLVDTKTWRLSHIADLRSTPSSISGTVIISLFIGCFGFLLLVALLVSLIIYYKRRSPNPRYSVGIAPPKLLTEHIWIELPSPASELEMTLINPYSSYYDDATLKARAMSMLQIPQAHQR